MKFVKKPAYVFTHNSYDGDVVTVSVEKDGQSIEDLLETFINFLRACTFVIDSGSSVEYIPAEVKEAEDKARAEEQALALRHEIGPRKKKRRSKK